MIGILDFQRSLDRETFSKFNFFAQNQSITCWNTLYIEWIHENTKTVYMVLLVFQQTRTIGCFLLTRKRENASPQPIAYTTGISRKSLNGK